MAESDEWTCEGKLRRILPLRGDGSLPYKRADICWYVGEVHFLKTEMNLGGNAGDFTLLSQVNWDKSVFLYAGRAGGRHSSRNGI